MTVCVQVTNQGDKDTQLKKLLGFNARVIEAWALRPEKAAEMVGAEKTAAAEAAGKAAKAMKTVLEEAPKKAAEANAAVAAAEAAAVAANEAMAAAEAAAVKKSSICALL